MSPRSIRRAAERKAAKLARKAERTNNQSTTMTTNNNTPTPPSPSTEEQKAANPYADQIAAAVAAATMVDSNLLSAALEFGDDDYDHDEHEKELQEARALAAQLVEKARAAGADASASESNPSQISAARLAANRLNAQSSTGPRTATGKSRVSMNAIKTGITSQTVVLTAAQMPAYEQHMERRLTKYAPIGDDENMLVQTIIDNEWRLAQIAPLESAIYSIGARLFTSEFADEENPIAREALLRGHIYLHYRRDLANLSLQDRRLRNNIKEDVAQLESLQKSRLERRNKQVCTCVKLKSQLGAAFQPSDCGFDFSTSELEAFLAETATLFKLTERRGDFDKFLMAYRSAQKEAKAA